MTIISYLTKTYGMVSLKIVRLIFLLQKCCVGFTVSWIFRLEMVHVIGWSVKGPDELLVREACAEWRAWEGAAGDHLVSHHLETVEHGDGVGRELHPPVLLVPHVGAGAALLTQDPELSQGQPVHQ